MQSWNNHWSLSTNHACLNQYWLPKSRLNLFQHADAFEKCFHHTKCENPLAKEEIAHSEQFLIMLQFDFHL